MLLLVAQADEAEAEVRHQSCLEAGTAVEPELEAEEDREMD